MSYHSELQALVDDLEFLCDWEERYRYLIELGRALPSMAEEEKIDSNKIPGCMSQVWLTLHCKGNVLNVSVDSDAVIVKGLLAILMKAYHQQPVDVLEKIDLKALFDQLDLEQHLSLNRRNGFFAIQSAIAQKAKECMVK